VVVWNGRGVGDSNGIYARRYVEATDTAGPLVSDFSTSGPLRIDNGTQVTQEVSFLVVTFDENMLTAGPNSVTNPANYRLMLNGAQLTGRIKHIDFGLNEGSLVMGTTVYPPTNKYEAVLELDSNPATPAYDPLTDGHYELVVMGNLRDTAGNPMGVTGLTPGGIASVSRSFDILVPRNFSEVRVNKDPAGGQYTYDVTNADAEPGTQAVASDANGDYVVAWTNDETSASPGLYAKLYQVTWGTDSTTGARKSTIAEVPAVNPATNQPWPNNEILVATETATLGLPVHPAVARDADGDFVVTWSQEDLTDSARGWDVYASRYNAAGECLNWRTGPFQVNTETNGIQRYSAVAMDPEGDFVIAWQGLNSVASGNPDQDLNGYGVYAQRYSPSGVPVGGTDEEQLINFKNNPRGTFKLQWDANRDGVIAANEQTVDITFSGSTQAVAQAIQNALDTIQEARDGLHLGTIVVQAVSANQVLVRFTGKDGSQDLPQMTVFDKHLTGPAGADVFATTAQEGVSGEFRVNDTTLGDQMWPSISMDAQGAFAISWTGFGQDPDGTGPLPADAAFEGNVYVKRFISNTALLGPYTTDRVYSTTFTPQFPNSAGKYAAVTSGLQGDTPDAHKVFPGQGADGVVQVLLNGQPDGTGSLLVQGGGRYVLTAAHVAGDIATGLAFPAANISVVFNLPTGNVTIGASQITVYPTWIPIPGQGGDIALITLSSPAPAAAQRFDIYRGSDELYKNFSVYGYGNGGVGMTGQDPVLYPYGTKRWGQNRFETLGTALGYSPDILGFDFDDGTDTHDAFGQLLGIHDTGLGPANEVDVAQGDSGGPTFINGLIAGVASFGVGIPATDVDGVTDFGFGEAAFETRVSDYAPWIDQITSGTTAETLVNQFTTGMQEWSSVAMDENGEFVVTWTSYNQDAPSGLNGIFARRFNNQGQPAANEFQVNTYSVGNQQRPRVAMDGAGDFAIAWESYQDAPQSGDDADATATYGIYAQRYARAALIGTSPFIGANGELGGELRANGTIEGDQRFPSVAMDHAGDFVVVWSGNGTVPGQADTQGVFYNRYESTTDQAGPIVADTLRVQADSATSNSLWLLRNGMLVNKPVPQVVVDFDEDLSITGGLTGRNSVLNPNNWELDRNGVPVTGAIASVNFALNRAYTEGLETTKPYKYQAVVTFDADPSTPAVNTLGDGDYTLTIHDTVWDKYTNRLDGNYDGLPGGDFHRDFTISGSGISGEVPPGGGGELPGDPDPNTVDPTVPLTPAARQDSPAVASDARGNYVVVWVVYGQGVDAATDGNIVAQRFNAAGRRQGSQFTVNSVLAGSQIQPDVAMNPNGDFVIVWSGPGQGDTGSGIFGRWFDNFGVPQGPEFRVNVYTDNIQDTPAVAMDQDGDFVVTWNSYNSRTGTPDRHGVWARRYDNLRQPQPMAGATETANPPAGLNAGVLVNTFTNNNQQNADVAMDGNGSFTVVWQSDGQDGVSWGVFGQRFATDGSRIAGEFQVNSYTPSAQYDAQIAMDPAGDFVVAWSSFVEPGDGSGYGVFAQRYNAAGQRQGAEFRVNQNLAESNNRWTTDYWQYQPAVAMAGNGMFVVTWSTFGQRTDARDFDIHARTYYADGSDVLNTATGVPWFEFRINANLFGDQTNSAVAMDGVGNFVTVWVGPDATNPLIISNVFYRVVNSGGSSTSGTSQSALFAGWSGGWSTAAAGGTTPTSQMLIGTAGNDQVTIVLGPTPSTWQVQINGTTQRVGGNVAVVGFDGRGGNDTVTIRGASGAAKVELWPDHTILTGDGFTFTTANTETVKFTGLSGADNAIYHDSAGDDLFTFRADAQPGASLTGAGFALSTANVAKVQAVAAAGGNDVARLYDSSRTDTFTAYPTYAVMTPSDNSYSVTSSGFDALEAYSAAGGLDTARLYDDRNANDIFVADSAGATLSSPSYRLQASGFRYVHATSNGGTDTATLRDSAGNDTFDAYPTYASLSNSTFYVRANAFKQVTGESRQGTDLARLYGTAGNDQFEARPDYGHLTGTGYDNGAKNFRYLTAYGNGGAGDFAKFYDSGAADTYVATPTYGVLYTTTYANRASGFARNEVVGTAGSGDVARLYDSPGDDLFIADSTSAALSTPTGAQKVNNFRFVYAYATAGGNDTASFTAPSGSSGSNTFEGRSTYSALSGTAGSGYYVRAVGFDSVEALSSGNANDIARLYDSAGNDAFDAYAAYAVLSGPAFSNRATGFRNVYAYAQSGGTDIANLYGSSGDDTFVGGPDYGMLSGATYRNRANYFDEVHAHAVAGGNDTATLYDSPGNDFFLASGNLAKLSNADLGFLLDAVAFGKVTATSSNPGDTAQIDAHDYILQYQKSW